MWRGCINDNKISTVMIVDTTFTFKHNDSEVFIDYNMRVVFTCVGIAANLLKHS